ncbi:hypothetical protein GCM10010420_40960 [Streptomyces glaucosporus]|uniref:Secreted protein n=1 Tax=Streptomyces glaucosporus TaxID=284044 RepID=A0ABN3ILN2_9ACTN
MLDMLPGLLAVPAAFAVGTAVWTVLLRPPADRDLWEEQERHHLLRTVVTHDVRRERSVAARPARKDWHTAA